MPEFTASTTLRCSAAALRQYLGATAKIPLISDPELELEVLEAPDQVTADAIIEFRITAFGFKQRMQHRYTEVGDTEIVAEQVEGPTRTWVHRQSIAVNDDGTCVLTDHVEFEPPGGMMGFVLTEASIRESLEDGMVFRYEALRGFLETSGD
ncbi:MAG: hypothetical protein GY903_19970 [Fuerstiella sp.]|nr:hypothetical protein [Fuerstiella sp.]MCP4856766.1 hypothetical protein [Fuerstiella sp.]